jgi:hypothetical protein
VLKILDGVNGSLDVGGQVNILVPVYPENIKDSDNYTVDFFPTFFLGCTMGQGGPQKLSTYRSWLEESGFTVTKEIAKDPADIPSYSLPVHGILCATKDRMIRPSSGTERSSAPIRTKDAGIGDASVPPPRQTLKPDTRHNTGTATRPARFR